VRHIGIVAEWGLRRKGSRRQVITVSDAHLAFVGVSAPTLAMQLHQQTPPVDKNSLSTESNSKTSTDLFTAEHVLEIYC